ncbi:hypothetical protein T484DRAFT_1786757 [Baffinella frigidus]|nr:hypothetical protein T484DRAFT_1786757 [Cryptophyta sp. CCMP2293]
MSAPAKPRPPKVAKEVAKAKRGISNSGSAGMSGGPVVDVKAWKAAQKAAAAGASGGNAAEDEKKADRQKRFGAAAGAACDASAKQALDTVKKSDKKGQVVKGFVAQLAGAAGGGKDKQGGGGGGAAAAAGGGGGGGGGGAAGTGLLAAAPVGIGFRGARRDGTKDPKVLLQEFCSKQTIARPLVLLSEFCSKQKIARPGVVTEAEKGGFRGKFILHAKEGGSATVRTTKEVFATSDEAQQAAAVLGLFIVAGDRSKDMQNMHCRLMPPEYGSLWKGAEQDEAARTKKDADWAQRKAEQEAQEV